MKKLKMRILSIITALSAAVSSILVPLGVQASASSDQRIIVSIGDSYSAGEGIEPFYGQDKEINERVKDQDWLAHRSKNAWGGMLTLSGVNGKMSKNRGKNWFFAAATGAETKHLHKGQEIKYDREGVSGKATLDPQENVLKEHSGKIDYVTLTIGGNDFGFADIMTAALTKDADDLQKYINDKLKGKKYETITSNIKQYYKDVASLAGSQAAIIVAGYPYLFNSKGFTVENVPITGTVTISADVAGIVNSSVDKFNNILNVLVDECRSEGINIWFAPVDFKGHEAYTTKPYINSVIFGAQEQDTNSKAFVSSYSIHPNKSGASVYATAVQKIIDSIESGNAVTITADLPEPDITTSISGSSVKLTWKAVSGAKSYTVYQSKNGKWKKLKTVSKTTYTVTKLTNNTTCEFMVRAKVNGKLTSEENSYKVPVKVCYKPVLETSVKNGKLTLKWSEVNGASKYGVYEYKNGDWKLVKSTTKLTYTVSVKSGSTYKYAVKALVGDEWTKIDKTSKATVKA